jgi:enamine deaminase RidA (YjgF/YER057c/UK114 family)
MLILSAHETGEPHARRHGAGRACCNAVRIPVGALLGARGRPGGHGEEIVQLFGLDAGHLLGSGDHHQYGQGQIHFPRGIGAEDENGPRGAIRHRGDFAAQCAYAYDKIKRALAANGSSLKEAVKMTVYVTDMRNRLDWAKCSGEAFAGATVPAQTLLGISQLAFPEMMLEIDVTAVSHE